MLKKRIENMLNKDYHEAEGISSSVLKTALKSPAHLDILFKKGFKKSKAMSLGEAIHCYILEPKRFEEDYSIQTETYKRKIGDHNVGDPKLDDEGNPIRSLVNKNNDELNVEGEEFVKFNSMIDAYNNCPEAKELVSQQAETEVSYFYDRFKVRPDMITKDGWIVDIKTVGGIDDNPSDPKNFCNDFFKFGYDLQMYMYENIIKQFNPNIKGFKFLCLDAKEPSGVKIYTFINGQSKWFEIGGYRFHDALKIYDEYKQTNNTVKYSKVCEDDMDLSYAAADYLSTREV